MQRTLILLEQSEKIHVFFENNWEDQTSSEFSIQEKLVSVIDGLNEIIGG
jgi:hypothetical protein